MSQKTDPQATESDPWTIKRLLDWTSKYLADHGSDSGRLDAEILLSESLDCQRIQLYTRFDQVPQDEELTAYREMVRRRADGSPVAYLVGHREFFSLPFEVNESVLIPRPETELLVVNVLDIVKQQFATQDSVTVLDIGTGSGNIAISIAKQEPKCKVLAVDISSDALRVATRNAESLNVADRVTLLESDLFENVPTDRQFDIIVSNPPYIAEGDPEVEAGVKNHEPHVALYAGDDGMEVIARLVENATRFLKQNGTLLFEISPFIETKCRELLESTDDLTDVQILNDLSNLPRVALTKRK